MQSCVYATVLEKTTEDAAFITPAPTNPVPGGTYMKMNASDFSAVNDAEISGTGYADINLGYEEVIDTFSITSTISIPDALKISSTLLWQPDLLCLNRPVSETIAARRRVPWSGSRSCPSL